MKSGDQAEPKLGDISKYDEILDPDDEQSQMNDIEVKKEKEIEDSSLDIRDSELEILIAESKIDMT